MQKLIEGVHWFRKEEFGRYRRLFQRLAREGQRPHTLFITCSDSRVLAELITQSKPGELFVVKNVGNIVPPFSATGSTNSTAAAVEFAVQSLKVRDLVVCSHSQCGAMRALLDGVPDAETSPHLCQWLELAAPVRRVIEQNYAHLTEPAARASTAAEENGLFALENLHTYPIVRRALECGALRLHAWFFNIATAELFAYDPGDQQYKPILPPNRTRRKSPKSRRAGKKPRARVTNAGRAGS
jgi:carbonic anhydrase